MAKERKKMRQVNIALATFIKLRLAAIEVEKEAIKMELPSFSKSAFYTQVIERGLIEIEREL